MQIKVAGDILDFEMHSNVFEFDKSHAMFKTSYIKNNPITLIVVSSAYIIF